MLPCAHMRGLPVLSALALVGCGALPAAFDAGGAVPDAGGAQDDGDDAGSGAPVLVDGGAVFSVWAPHSDAVTLRGDFGEVAMTRGPGNVWTAMAKGAAAGMRYHLDVMFDGGVVKRTDPRARQVDPVTKDGVLYDGDAYAWKSGAFTPPPRSEQIVYE